MNTWILALKEWNSKQTGKYHVPKKGTPEYEQVKKIQMKMNKTLSAPKNEFNDNVKLYKRTKKNIKEVNSTYEATKPLQKQTINNLKKANSLVGKFSQDGGSLRKALNFASRNPSDFVKLVNQQQTGNGLNQVGGFLPAFIIPFLPAITTALGAFATGAIGAVGAYAVDEIIGDGMNGGEILDPNIDLISEINDLWTELIGLGMTAPQKNKLKKKLKGGSLNPADVFLVSRMARDINKKAKQQKGGNNPGWAELTLANEIMYPLQNKLPGLNTETGKIVAPSNPFDFLNFKF